MAGLIAPFESENRTFGCTGFCPLDVCCEDAEATLGGAARLMMQGMKAALRSVKLCCHSHGMADAAAVKARMLVALHRLYRGYRRKEERKRGKENQHCARLCKVAAAGGHKLRSILVQPKRRLMKLKMAPSNAPV